MSLQNFMAEVERSLEHATAAELKQVLRSLAEQLPLSQREDFARTLKMLLGDGESEESKKRRQKEHLEALQHYLDGDLSRLERGEEVLVCKLSKYGADIEKPREFQHRVMDGEDLIEELCSCGLYEQSLQLAHRLLAIKIPLSGPGAATFGFAFPLCGGSHKNSLGFFTIDSIAATMVAAAHLYSDERYWAELYALCKALGGDFSSYGFDCRGGSTRALRSQWLAYLAGLNEEFAAVLAQNTIEKMVEVEELLTLARLHYRRFPQLYKHACKALERSLKGWGPWDMSDGFGTSGLSLAAHWEGAQAPGRTCLETREGYGREARRILAQEALTQLGAAGTFVADEEFYLTELANSALYLCDSTTARRLWADLFKRKPSRARLWFVVAAAAGDKQWFYRTVHSAVDTAENFAAETEVVLGLLCGDFKNAARYLTEHRNRDATTTLLGQILLLYLYLRTLGAGRVAAGPLGDDTLLDAARSAEKTAADEITYLADCPDESLEMHDYCREFNERVLALPRSYWELWWSWAAVAEPKGISEDELMQVIDADRKIPDRALSSSSESSYPQSVTQRQELLVRLLEHWK